MQKIKKKIYIPKNKLVNKTYTIQYNKLSKTLFSKN